MKKNYILSLLIGIVLIAMFLPWAYSGRWANAPGVNPESYYEYNNFFGSMLTGSLYLGLSFLLALPAFVLSFFSGKKQILRVFCGIILLVSAGLCLYEGIWGGFDCFTVLSWAIFGALVLLGIWTLFFLREKARQDV